MKPSIVKTILYVAQPSLFIFNYGLDKQDVKGYFCMQNTINRMHKQGSFPSNRSQKEGEVKEAHVETLLHVGESFNSYTLL